METKEAYNLWSEQYDTNINKTRDVEAIALRKTLEGYSFSRCLEIGCGTGKNTEWILQRADHITAVDLSDEMIARAKSKINSDKVQFVQADIRDEWNFDKNEYGLVSFSLVLEHIENLSHIFRQVYNVLKPGGFAYIGELHPYKQYAGTKARFETEEGLQILECYNHNISDFINAAKMSGLELIHLNEFFDDDNKTIPRILVLLFKKS
jgi:ubiquinone/menaquinone biosynthesis C-methylase UbiE